MSYQVLARKYRPQAFAEVIGQEHITTTLGNALALRRIHHAYLFTGVRGVGKTTVARILAKALNCKEPRGFEPCGSCGPCRDITEGRSLDVQEIDGASNTGVDDVREIRERVKYMPSSSHYKIYIIDEVHMLSTPAFNALLKTLEEPPAHVVFIFATTESHKIPATIISRCQRYDFRRISASLIASSLAHIAKEEGVAADGDVLGLIAREATGSLRDAQSLFDQAIAYSGDKISTDSIKSMLGFLDRGLLFGAIEAALAKDAKRALAILDEVFTTGADLVRFSGDILEIIRHLLVLSECQGERTNLDLTSDEVEVLKTLVAKAEPTQLHQMFSLWYGVSEQVARSPFPKMLLEVGLIRLARIHPAKPIGEIIAKLDALLEGRQTPAPKPASSAVAINTSAENAGLTFEPVDVESERRWQEFMRWLAGERPQAAAILDQGQLEGMGGGTVRVRFDNPHLADMQTEEERCRAVEELMQAFFKRPMKLAVNSEGTGQEQSPKAPKHERKKELVKEALSDDIVRQAADILGAKLHDVKVEKP